MEHKDFLVEIGTEELPPKALKTLGEAFYNGIQSGFADKRITATSGEYYFSPRRLAVLIRGIPVTQDDIVEERLGPAVQAAFDKNGKPTKAAEGFAASVGTAVEKLERKATDKGERLAFTVTIPGKTTAELLPDIVRDSLKKLPIPKRMRWGAGEAEFVRPVQWVLMLFGENVVDCEIFGVKAARETAGHRFHAPGRITIDKPADYPAKLEKAGHVKVNNQAGTLSSAIRQMAVTEATKLHGTPEGLESELPDEIAALNEWPVPVVGNIPERFMALPEEALITTIETHQRYFPVRGPEVAGKPGKLLPKFITFANIESKQPDVVRQGNERVVVPRLEDAMFFWNADRQTKLAERSGRLDQVTFQKTLGSYGDKVRRVIVLAKTIAGAIGADKATVERAAQLAKCDLLTDMVGEFPELQGVMGRYYAQHDGEPAEVAQAIFEQYLPRFAGDALPVSKTGQALAIADKLDTICGIFAIGQIPSGSKDPFALRRLALGLLRVIIEQQLELDLVALIQAALQQLPTAKAPDELQQTLLEFFYDRLKAYYLEQAVRADVFEAVRARRPHQPLDFDRRVKAVQAFMQRDEAAALAAANKRISNILRKAETEVSGQADTTLFESEAERALATAVADKAKAIAPLAAKGDYGAMLDTLSALRSPVDQFFDNVMVMAEDPALRANRLRLLQQLRELFNHTADFAQLQVE